MLFYKLLYMDTNKYLNIYEQLLGNNDSKEFIINKSNSIPKYKFLILYI